jgi:sarcosine oxidase subunit gamma
MPDSAQHKVSEREHALTYRGLATSSSPAGQDGAGVRLWLEPACGQLCLRGDANGEFAAQVQTTFGVSLPTAANTASERGDRRILWLGPDEWLAICANNEVMELHESLQRALQGEHALISDVSHSRAIIALEGAHARAVLNKGCGLDLDPVAFAAGQCAQTSLARAHMLLHQINDTPRYHIYAHRSFADYVFSWLEDAAREYL